MADYWKSAGNYWCKFCEVFVRDTKFERNRHENSGRHQSAIQRQLRESHKKAEREEREKKKVQAELARLNKVVGSSSSSESKPQLDSESLPWKKKAHTFNDQPYRVATAEERRAQAEQLAALGVDVPQTFRNLGTEPSQWQVVSVTTHRDVKTERDEDDIEARARGVRGIKKEESEEEKDLSRIPEDLSDFHNKKTEEPPLPTKRKNRSEQLAEDDLDDLFGGVAKKVKREADQEETPTTEPASEDQGAIPNSEASDAQPKQKNRAFARLVGTNAPVIFKKRKATGAPPMDVLG